MKFSHASVDEQSQNLLIHVAQLGQPDIILNLALKDSGIEIATADQPIEVLLSPISFALDSHYLSAKVRRILLTPRHSFTMRTKHR